MGDPFMRILAVFTLSVATILVGCGSKPQVCVPVLSPLTLEETVQMERLRAESIAKLKGYQVDVTTREAFLTDGWRPVLLTEPMGCIGYDNFSIERDAQGQIKKSTFPLVYYDFASGRVGVTPSKPEYAIRRAKCLPSFERRGRTNWRRQSRAGRRLRAIPLRPVSSSGGQVLAAPPLRVAER